MSPKEKKIVQGIWLRISSVSLTREMADELKRCIDMRVRR